jgi:hypothetical protein
MLNKQKKPYVCMGGDRIIHIDKQKQWKPEIRCGYYFIDEWFDVNKTVYDKYEIHGCRAKVGNCFRTRKEAEEKLKAIKLVLKSESLARLLIKTDKKSKLLKRLK